MTPLPVPALPPLLLQPLRGVAAWTAHFAAAEIPVLAASAEALAALRDNEDEVDAHLLAELLAEDPLITLAVMAEVARQHAHRLDCGAETLTSALLLMGISPFFRRFAQPVTVEH